LIVGLTFTSASAEQVGCSFSAPATVGTADLVPIPSPPSELPPEVSTVTGLTSLGTAGCSDTFGCAGVCAVQLQFGFVGTGVIAGEVTLYRFTNLGIQEIARATCGPSISTLATGGCFGTLNTTITSPGFVFLDCRAHGVVAVLVSGSCSGFAV
jgi:hypothetical protein